MPTLTIEVIKPFIYFPRLGGHRFTQYQCAHSISGREDKNGRYIKYHQCEVKPTEELLGYHFCLQHYRMLMRLQDDNTTKLEPNLD